MPYKITDLAGALFMEMRRIELLTPALQGRCSPN